MGVGRGKGKREGGVGGEGGAEGKVAEAKRMSGAVQSRGWRMLHGVILVGTPRWPVIMCPTGTGGR